MKNSKKTFWEAEPPLQTSDLVVGGGGWTPQLFSQPPSSFYEICLGGRLQPSQLFDTSHKI